MAKMVAKVDKGIKATTVRRVHALIGVALHQAEKWDLVERNVARRASPPPVHALQVTASGPAQVRAIVVEAEKVEPALAVMLLPAARGGWVEKGTKTHQVRRIGLDDFATAVLQRPPCGSRRPGVGARPDGV